MTDIYLRAVNSDVTLRDPTQADNSGGVTGTVASTSANDAAFAIGTTAVHGSTARTNAADVLASAGATAVLGTLARASANDTLSAVGSLTVSGAASIGVLDNMAGTGSPIVRGVGDAITGMGIVEAMGIAGTSVPAPTTKTKASGRRGYIIRGRRLMLTRDELAWHMAQEVALHIAQEAAPTKAKPAKPPAKPVEIRNVQFEDEDAELLLML
jgi:hypothetical protein